MRRTASTLALIVASLGFAPSAAAHTPNIASFELSQGPERARLDVHMSTDGMHHVMRARLPGVSFRDMAVEDYERHVLAALREGIELRYDDHEIVLGEAQVALASHQSDVSFTIPAPPVGATQLHAHIDVMHEQHNQNNVLRLVTQTSRAHVVLKSSNDFRGSLALPASSRPAPTASFVQGIARLVGLLLSLLPR
ncbi:hypothetical protein G6O69_07385 [Pseudenhygromyxa sp. WMMC2535]|uniref:hypothetical protein n=1 Tax=Pseudenhygromyxa sp. WMMC2535 TaxID=2712867 RepID=UPI001551D111|nr:hypothetical protein [Pseudenhygromyxa sp. WMMC2535]NVB37650.1 hypothetical protein [Pseudenhygromyxa sp. WMMC2535]